MVQLSCTSAKSFPDFVGILIVKGQNPSLLLYLGQAFIDDYTFRAKAWRSISLKISICLQVIGVTCSKGKCCTRGRFLQETRKRPLPAVNQLLQEEPVFSPSPADTQGATQTGAVVVLAGKDDSTGTWNPGWLCRTASLLYICFPVSPKPFSCLLSISKGGVYSNSLFAFTPLSFHFQSSAAEALGCAVKQASASGSCWNRLCPYLSLCWHWTDKTYLLWRLVQGRGL